MDGGLYRGLGRGRDRDLGQTAACIRMRMRIQMQAKTGNGRAAGAAHHFHLWEVKEEQRRRRLVERWMMRLVRAQRRSASVPSHQGILIGRPLMGAYACDVPNLARTT